MLRSFLLVVLDHDKRTFAVEGPMKDDTPWNAAVVAAQDAGRTVTCFSGDEDLDVETVAADVKQQFGFDQAARGSIVRP
jgi:hypothetical protein